MNQYSTPRERIDRDFRSRIDSGAFISSALMTNVAKRDDAWVESDAPMAMIYSPEAAFSDIYEEEEALSKGTLFSDLCFPFERSSCRGNGGMGR
ncbi:MAG: spore coat associated protein CotJA [Clostridia bacterium]|nr:spore coat associated protein CotJA [Clostridia bacterium]